MKKTISLILCITLTVSLLATAAFAQGGLSYFQKTLTYTQGKFSDVASSDWFSMNVKAAYEYGLINGKTPQHLYNGQHKFCYDHTVVSDIC